MTRQGPPRVLGVLLAAAAAGLVAAPVAAGERVVAERQWDSGGLPEGTQPAEAPGPADGLRIEGRPGQPTRTPLWSVAEPRFSRAAHAVRGSLRHQGVDGVGYLEMWTAYGPDERYFSRTLAPSGPLRGLTGSGEWRTFALPFFGDGRSPSLIELALVLPGAGRVELGPLELVEIDGPVDLAAVPGAWWGERTGGILGGAFGAVFGATGCAVGILCALGRGRRPALALLAALTIAGAVALLIGSVAAATGQPYAVYYPLLLAGAVAVPLGPLVSRRVRDRFEALELRRMQTLDATG